VVLASGPDFNNALGLANAGNILGFAAQLSK
jgi:hypothetical protein